MAFNALLKTATTKLGARAELNRRINAGAAGVPAEKPGQMARGCEFDKDQTAAERRACFDALGKTAREGLRVALVEGIIRPSFPEHDPGDNPTLFYMATREEVAGLEGKPRRLRQLCNVWSLHAYSCKKCVLFDMCGWLPDGVEIGVGVLVGDGAPRVVYRNNDGALALAPLEKDELEAPLAQFAEARL